MTKADLILGDCLEKMKDIPDNSVDLVLTDPPYGLDIVKADRIGYDGSSKTGVAGFGVVKNTLYEPSDWDKKIPSKEIFDEIFRVSKNQIIFGGNYFIDYLNPTQCMLIWDKRCKNHYVNNFSDCEIAWTSFNKPARVFRHLWMGMLRDSERAKHYHPTQKPVALMEWIIKNYSKDGELILDPFMGSGSTGVAALKLQRRFIGIELDKNYFKIAKERIEKESNQGRLGLFDTQWK